MAGFRKAKAEQAAIKMGFYGAAGRGKTFTALVVAEGLAKATGKRIAFVDTEHGSDFYCKTVPARKPHPEAFDFDALYTRSLSETISAVEGIDANTYGVVIIDSMTHLWEAARNAWSGKTTKAGTLPIYAWAQIKKPYKQLMTFLLSSPLHVIICGREGKEVEEDEESGEMKIVGTKMKAEGETPYEPHILLHLFTERQKDGTHGIIALAEKDRSGLLANRRIQLWPSDKSAFELLAKPVLDLLDGTQAKLPDEDETAVKDAENIAAADAQKIVESERLLVELSAKIQLCKTPAELKALGKTITPELKKGMMPSDVADLRTRYQEAEKHLRA